MRDPDSIPKPTILLLGTCDTKKDEILYTSSRILSHNAGLVRILDLGRTRSVDAMGNLGENCIYTSISPDYHYWLSTFTRAGYIDSMIHYASEIVSNLYKEKRIQGVIGLGGSCGTSLATGIMRQALPVGFPKMMVSTMASGDVKPYVEETDITMMYSVVDIAGTNWILNRILSNAAAAISAMAVEFEAAQAEEYNQQQQQTQQLWKKRIGVTMFGVTTPCVDRIRQYLEHVHGYEVYVFHATGAGGKAMERLIGEKQLDAVIDITTSEIADELIGGVLTAGPSRLDAAASAGIPQVISVGACDLVNFGPKNTVPAKFQDRLLHEHNPTVTVMRTTAEESRQIAQFIADKLRAASCPDLVRVMLPTKGISLLDVPGQSFHDPKADEVLFSTLEEELADSGISIVRDDRDINDPGFAIAAADALAELIKQSDRRDE